MLPKHEKRWDRRKHEAGHALPLYAALRILDDLPPPHQSAHQLHTHLIDDINFFMKK